MIILPKISSFYHRIYYFPKMFSYYYNIKGYNKFNFTILIGLLLNFLIYKISILFVLDKINWIFEYQKYPDTRSSNKVFLLQMNKQWREIIASCMCNRSLVIINAIRTVFKDLSRRIGNIQ